MSVAYAAPMYIGISTMLCLSYSCIEFIKNKGKLKDSDKSILSAWCIVSIIVASVVMGASAGLMTGMPNITYLIIAILLACITLSISSSMIYWS